MNAEYKIKRITVNWAEDARVDGKEFTKLRELDAALAAVGMFKDPTGGYCKTEVELEYQDGEVYKARVDVCHPGNHPYLGIAAHVTRFNQAILEDLEEAAKLFDAAPADLELDAKENIERINTALALEIEADRFKVIANREAYEKERKARAGG